MKIMVANQLILNQKPKISGVRRWWISSTETAWKNLNSITRTSFRLVKMFWPRGSWEFMELSQNTKWQLLMGRTLIQCYTTTTNLHQYAKTLRFTMSRIQNASLSRSKYLYANIKSVKTAKYAMQNLRWTLKNSSGICDSTRKNDPINVHNQVVTRCSPRRAAWSCTRWDTRTPSDSLANTANVSFCATTTWIFTRRVLKGACAI